jgi:hypothetical protein
MEGKVRSLLKVLTSFLFLSLSSVYGEEVTIEKIGSIPIEGGIYYMMNYEGKLWINTGERECSEETTENGYYICKTKIAVVNPETGEKKELWADGTISVSMSGAPVFGIIDGYVLMGNTLFDPNTLSIAAKVENCDKVCPWSETIYASDNKVFYMDDNTLRIFEFTKEPNGNYTYNEEISFSFSDICSEDAIIESVGNSFLAVKCDNTISIWKYKEGSLLKVGSDFLEGQNIILGENGFAILKSTNWDDWTSYYEFYKLLDEDEATTNNGLDYKKVGEYSINCSRPPKLFFEEGIGICDTEENGFLIFDIYNGTEIYKYTEEESNIWEVTPYNENYIAIGGWLASLNGTGGIEWFKINIENVLGTEEETQTEESENTITFFLKEGWNLVGTSYPLNISYFNKPEVLTVWKWTENSWQFWSPEPSLMEIAQSYGLAPITEINANEGFWVKTTTQVSIPVEKLQ